MFLFYGEICSESQRRVLNGDKLSRWVPYQIANIAAPAAKRMKTKIH